MKFALKIKTKKDKSTEIVPSLLLTPPNICAWRMCNAESQKRSAKGSDFKEEDRALPL